MKTLPTRALVVVCVVIFAGTFPCVVSVAAQTADTSPVEQLLTEASGYQATGRFDLADKRYRQILALDPDNEAASLGRSGLKDARARYEKAMAENIRIPAPARNATPDTVDIQRKLQTIVIPYLEVHDMTLNDAVELLRKEARLLDPDPDVDERGVNIFLKLGSGNPLLAKTDASIPSLPPGAESSAPATPGQPTPGIVPTDRTRISLTLVRLPLGAVLDYVAKAANLKVKVEPHAVSIVPLNFPIEELLILEMRIPPSFIGPESAPSSSPAMSDVTGVNSLPLQRRMDAKGFLESCGVTFPPGSPAVYLSSTSKLVIRNTQANLDLVQALVGDYTGLSQNSDFPTPTPIQ